MNKFKQKLELIKKDKGQHSAFKSERSTVVIAGPGSGKTTVLTLKILYLLREKIPIPRGLACITFNREAAKEFKDRLSDLGYKDRKNVFLGTVHSFCISEIITPFAHLYDINIPFPLKIVSNREKIELFNAIIEDFSLGQIGMKIEDMDKERNLNISGLSKVTIPSYEVALKVAFEFEKRLHQTGKVDFVDIVKFSTDLIQKNDYVRKCLESKFPWILIDEYQDLGKPLHEMILSLVNLTKINLFAVGDPDQSIYGFNGAIPDYLMELNDHPYFESVFLTTNYRSAQGIINASMSILEDGYVRGYTAGLRYNEEAEFHFITCNNGMEDQYQKVANEIIPNCIRDGIPLDEIAILVRSNTEVQQLSKVLEEAHISYYISKNKFERSEVVILLERFANWSIDKTRESFTKLFDFWMMILNNHREIPINDRLKIEERKKVYDILSKGKDYLDNLSKWLNFTIKNLNLIECLNESAIYPDEVENLQTLISLSSQGEFMSYDVDKFSKLGKPDNQVTISTRHSSKGLEFEVVVLLGMEKGNFPFFLNEDVPLRMQEERRVFFVCISRAKRVCYLLRSTHFISKRGNPYTRDKSLFWDLLYESMNKERQL